LTPDLAPLLSEADLAIFADASAEEFDDDIRVHTLSPSKPIMDGAHKSSSAELLGLAEWLYGHCPEAYGVDIAAVSFEFSLEISPRTQAAINTAVKCIDDIVSGSLENVKCMK
jgi:Ni,Fe-hydrogenase maturation factor